MSFTQHGPNVFEYKSKVNKKVLLLGLFLLTACGGTGIDDPSPSVGDTVPTQTIPVILAAVPASGSAGSTITVQGIGFSAAANLNIISLGGKSTAAATYAVLNPSVNGAAEALTFQIPSGTQTGAQNLALTMLDTDTGGLTSNAIPFTVLP